MARAWFVLVALTCSSISFAQAPARDVPALPSGTASIHGRVTDVNGHPLARVEIRAGNGNGQQTTALTDGEGRYDLNDLPAGVFAVQATKPNYVRTSWGEQRVEGPGKRITIAAGQRINNIDIKMARGGAITGKIVDEFGDPITDVVVMPMRYQYVQGTRRLMPTGRGGPTNDIGEFRLYGLTPGQYYVSAVLRPQGTSVTSFDPRGQDSSDRSGYAPTFYPGTGNVGEAQRLTVAAGQTITSINLTLLPIQTANISGSVVDTDGKPVAGGIVMTVPKNSAQVVNIVPTPVRPDGKFTVTGLAPGEYTLRAGNPMAAGEMAVADVTVTGSDVSGVVLAAAKQATIRGRVVFTQSLTGTEPPKVTTIDLGAVREWAMAQQIRSPARIKEDGTFEIALTPGHVQLRAAPTGGSRTTPPWRLGRVLFNDADAGDSGIDVSPGATIENVVVEITNRLFELSGRVTDDSGATVRDCFVVVFAQDPARWTVQTRYVIVGRPGPDDLYRVRLMPGDYYVVAMTDVEQNAWTDTDFLSAARERATKFSIADGETKTLNLTATTAPVF